MQEITVRNWRRSRSWGWGWSCRPTGQGTEIEAPSRPYYVGTWRQVSEAIREDRLFASIQSGGTYYRERWFYQGRPVVGTRYGDWFDGFQGGMLCIDGDVDATIRVE